MCDRDQHKWVAFGSIEKTPIAKAPTTITEAWGRSFASLLSSLTSAETTPTATVPLSADEQKRIDDERRVYKRRHESPWSSSSWYACYMHQHIENQRTKSLVDVQSPPAMAQFNPQVPPKVSAAKLKIAEWSGYVVVRCDFGATPAYS